MPIIQRDVPDLHESFVEDKKLQQMMLDLDLPEVQMDGISPEQARLRSETARQALETLSGNDAPAWLADYYMLKAKGWPFPQAAYIAWASSPTDLRVPKTQRELSFLLGLSSDRAISTWRKDDPAILETIALMQSAPLFMSRADSFANLVAGMKKSGEDYKFFNYLKMHLEMTGDYIPTSELVANLKKKISTDASDYSDDEIAVLAQAFEAYQAKTKIEPDNMESE